MFASPGSQGSVTKHRPIFRDICVENETMLRDFLWKSDPLEQHIPICLNMWVPPPPGVLSTIPLQADVNWRQPITFSKFITNFTNSNWHFYIWIPHEKCIQMSTNKPTIGSLIHEIAHGICENMLSNFTFPTLKGGLHVTFGHFYFVT